jgi:Fe-S-cluster containining protein
MTPNLGSTLCLQCGLCCDGSLFSDVELANDREASRLELSGVNIEEADEDEQHPLLLQPCTALRGMKCSIYKARPECCRTFECQLLQQVSRGITSPKKAMTVIRKAQRRIAKIETLLSDLGHPKSPLPLKERYFEASLSSFPKGSPLFQKSAALRRAMNSLERIIHDSFLQI